METSVRKTGGGGFAPFKVFVGTTDLVALADEDGAGVARTHFHLGLSWIVSNWCG
jgi:hypothetical protein